MDDNNPIIAIEKIVLKTNLASSDILEEVSFNIFQGDRIAIVGPSGAGKTSLLKILNRLINYTSGQIYFHDRPINKISPIELRQRIVLVPQEPKLLGMTVKEAIAYPLFLQQLSPQEIQQRILTWTELLRIREEWFDRNELQLSLGQRQLISLARGLVMQPEVLLLDEPTSAIDAGRADNLIKILIDLSINNNTTIIMVNHQLEIAEKFGDRVLYLDRGKLLKDTRSKVFNWQLCRENLVAAEAEVAREWL